MNNTTRCGIALGAFTLALVFLFFGGRADALAASSDGCYINDADCFFNLEDGC